MELAKSVEILLWGFIHHEAGHVRHTDFAVLKDPALSADHLVRNLFYALEDIRMERAHMALYPGAIRILSDLVAELVRIRFFEPPDSGNPQDAFFHFVLKHLRMTVLGQAALVDQVTFSRSILETAFGSGFVTRLNAVLMRILNATSTSDALDLALQVRQFLKDEIDARQNPPTPDSDAQKASSSQANGGDDGSATPDQAPQASDQDGESAAQPDSSSDDEVQAADDEPGDTTQAMGQDADDGDTDGSDSSGSGHDAGADADDALEALKAIAKGAGGDSSLGDLGEALGKLLNDQVEQQDDPVFSIPEEERFSTGYRDDRAVMAARSVSTRLAVQLRRKLESFNQVPNVPKTRGTRISRRHLSRVAFDDYRVFQSRTIGIEINTAVVTLLDASSSMSGESIRIASRAVLATSLALDSIPRLAHAVGAFPGRRGDDFIEVLKDFHEDSRLVSSRFGIPARHCTPMAEALLWAADQLANRPEERRVVYVATDGGPNDAPSALKMIAQLHRMGIEVHGLGIGTSDPYGLFDSFAQVEDVSKLPEAFMALSDRVLRRSA
ncbi:MAG TPA: DUF1194 domain-containing protein [Opitutaceae bacterium]|nr:DUF1194 domain-containing protein [Opitutaceae bacterium]